MDKYLVLIGNEYGFDVMNMSNLNYVDKDTAYKNHETNIEEYGFSAIFVVGDDKLELVEHYTLEEY